MKQEERRQLTIRRLLDTTKALIEEIGCQTMTMKDIVDRSGLSKGAIFHYVKSKNEIFVWVLLERLEATNDQFTKAVEQGQQSFDEPMEEVKKSIIDYENPNDITNKVLMYLLGKEEDPMIAEALKQYYERAVFLAKTWIETGQRHGVIPEAIDALRTADMFTLMTFGLRVRSSIPQVQGVFNAEELSEFISGILNPSRDRGKKRL